MNFNALLLLASLGGGVGVSAVSLTMCENAAFQGQCRTEIYPTCQNINESGRSGSVNPPPPPLNPLEWDLIN